MSDKKEPLAPCPLCEAPAKEMCGKAGCSARRSPEHECGFFHMDHWLPIDTWNELPRRAPSPHMAAVKTLVKKIDCECAGEGVAELGGCYRCLALAALNKEAANG